MPSKSVAAPKEVLSRNTLAPTNGSPVDASVMLPEIFPDCAVRALEVTNNNKIYFNDNIQRLVQNYRIGFIRLAQNDIKNGNYEEAQKLVLMML